ncbi:LytR/AlgR family response regulator transcription factor [Dyadobacter pollutisoli]|uniref:LytTR family DNA-binding domain-containing protein n=1 Tax=Dyadobacter pollutisoli TaxID=2910158 RepID=A0A9E8NEM8_9BACT|nr:LytTR family DNA-binding domain-containing protein [Dyadobacter pollutisoli]WAC12744.1 LytTR family DNA-binding domain-containing protein [Dyadobacter pollutisoli]
MVKVLIIDDEPKARTVLHHFIRDFVPEITEVRQVGSVREAENMLKYYRPGIIFLDVEMPHQSGFELLSSNENPPYDIIFTTAYNQYAIQAIRFSALDYLLKPVDPDDLRAAVHRHMNRQEFAKHKKQLYNNLVNNIEKKEIKDFKLAVPSSEGVYFFSIYEILRLEADRNYTVIHLEGKRPFVASKTLKHFEEMLDQFKFIRTHKSHLVNAAHIVRISNNNEYLILTDGSRVEVSRRKKDEVQQNLNIR